MTNIRKSLLIMPSIIRVKYLPRDTGEAPWLETLQPGQGTKGRRETKHCSSVGHMRDSARLLACLLSRGHMGEAWAGRQRACACSSGTSVSAMVNWAAGLDVAADTWEMSCQGPMACKRTLMPLLGCTQTYVVGSVSGFLWGIWQGDMWKLFDQSKDNRAKFSWAPDKSLGNWWNSLS